MTTRKCHNDNLHNCRYCRFSGRVCQGAPGYARTLMAEVHHEIPNRWEYIYSDGTVEAVGRPRPRLVLVGADYRQLEARVAGRQPRNRNGLGAALRTTWGQL